MKKESKEREAQLDARVPENTLDEVKTLLRKGMSYRDIADEIEISEWMVRRAVYILRRRGEYGNSQLQKVRSENKETE